MSVFRDPELLTLSLSYVFSSRNPAAEEMGFDLHIVTSPSALHKVAAW